MILKLRVSFEESMGGVGRCKGVGIARFLDHGKAGALELWLANLEIASVVGAGEGVELCSGSFELLLLQR